MSTSIVSSVVRTKTAPTLLVNKMRFGYFCTQFPFRIPHFDCHFRHFFCQNHSTPPYQRCRIWLVEQSLRSARRSCRFLPFPMAGTGSEILETNQRYTRVDPLILHRSTLVRISFPYRRIVPYNTELSYVDPYNLVDSITPSNIVPSIPKAAGCWSCYPPKYQQHVCTDTIE